MPHGIQPMLATLVDQPFDRPDWIYEIKWDGFRAIAEIENDARRTVAFYSRKLNSFHDKFPQVYEALKAIRRRMVLDGEVVALDESGMPSFQKIQNAAGNQDNLVYYVFDLLYVDGYDLRGLPQIERKRLLKAVLPESDRIRYCDHVIGQGTEFFRLAATRGLEGVIAKKADTPYLSGKRSEAWLKIKTQQRQEVIITGFTEPRGGRKYFGALVLGVYEDERLIYAGHTGTGFDEKELKLLHDKLCKLESGIMPYAKKPRTRMPVTWVRPELVCEVAFTEWTRDGSMRHPVYMGLRPDKDPRDVRRERREGTGEALAHAETEVATAQPFIQKTARLRTGPGIFSKEPPAKRKRARKQPGPEERRYFSPEPPGAGKEATLEINGHRVPISHPRKLYWPESGYTKLDMIRYYRRIASFILPYLQDRPISMYRTPDGIEGEGFFQKDQRAPLPDWAETRRIWSESNRAEINYVLCQNEETLVMLANLGCIEMNPWNSRVSQLDHPDWMVIDLDPEGVPFDTVVEAAQATREVLESAGAAAFCKTSGATGLHVYVPMGARYPYDIVKEFAHLVAVMVHRRIPAFTTLERNLSRRPAGIYLDYLQNRRGQTLAAPYCLRPRPGAPVSTPLRWEEVKPGLRPADFTLETIEKRLEAVGDLWRPVLGPGVDLMRCLERLQAANNGT